MHPLEYYVSRIAPFVNGSPKFRNVFCVRVFMKSRCNKYAASKNLNLTENMDLLLKGPTFIRTFNPIVS